MAHAHAVAFDVFIRFMVSASNKCEGSNHLWRVIAMQSYGNLLQSPPHEPTHRRAPAAAPAQGTALRPQQPRAPRGTPSGLARTISPRGPGVQILARLGEGGEVKSFVSPKLYSGSKKKWG